MDNLLFSPIPLDQLLAAITEKVIIAITQQQNKDQQEKLLTTKEVCKLFGITPVTVSAWIKKGKLRNCSESGKNLFKYSEVMGSLSSLKKYKVK